nr:MAG TPA: hypothetical protein [Caudoviricetes sp.]DAT03552.1 MAG TPA: hypothetical protein [Caudoviricetes sp.]DAU90616.1 MAG TPA: hypothetical protein [Bacteriophage sp.]
MNLLFILLSSLSLVIFVYRCIFQLSVLSR